MIRDFLSDLISVLCLFIILYASPWIALGLGYL